MRPALSGRSTRIWRSKRPARSRAGSRISGRLVAASSTRPVRESNPSSSTRSWFSVCSFSSWPPNGNAPRARPIASSSSMKMMAGAVLRACSNRSRTRAAPTPTNISTNSGESYVVALEIVGDVGRYDRRREVPLLVRSRFFPLAFDVAARYPNFFDLAALEVIEEFAVGDCVDLLALRPELLEQQDAEHRGHDIPGVKLDFLVHCNLRIWYYRRAIGVVPGPRCSLLSRGDAGESFWR